MDERASVALITALAAIWSRIRERHPDVPGAVILPAPTPRGRTNVLGHFAPLRWKPRHEQEQLIHEVVVVAEHLNRSPLDILETLIHEAAHAMNFQRGIKDCSASQYHNRKFKAAAEELGLTVSQVAHYGFALTKLADTTAAPFEDLVHDLERVLVHRRMTRLTRLPPTLPVGVSTPNGTPTTPSGPRKNRNRKAMCRCGHIIRASRKVLAATTIRCESCSEAFTQEE